MRQFQVFLRATGVSSKALDNSQRYSSGPDGPVVGVTWYEAIQYCRWLSDREQLPPDECVYPTVAVIEKLKAPSARGKLRLPDKYLDRTGYRLPTEAEWEYVCRAGAPTVRPYGTDPGLLGRYACYLSDRNRAEPVGRFKPNDFGAFDMLGNAMEWTTSQAVPYGIGRQGQSEEDREEPGLMDPEAGPQYLRMVMRGGAFTNHAAYVRPAHRFHNPPGARDGIVGFRVARTLPAPDPAP